MRALQRAGKEFAHVVLDLPLGILGWTLVVTGVFTGAGLAITLIGIPILTGTLLIARGLGVVERARARVLLDVDVPAPGPIPHRDGLLAKLLAPVRDAATWRAAAYFLALLPVSIVGFTVAVTIWSTALGLLTLPVWAWSLPHNGPQFGDSYFWNQWWQLAVASLAGAVLTPLAPWFVRPFAALDRLLVRSLLGASAKDARIERLEETRARSVDVAVEERKRIERDLHDGAQQRLVRLGMDLGLALEKFEDDPAAARGLVGEAHREAQRAIAELRDLVRGFHPAVLTDRGLDAALSALAARSPVPVRLTVDVPARPPASVEANAYFIVAESLANVARHAAARTVAVDVRTRDGRLRIEVADDGRGGADAGRGTGLSGLSDRAAAVDGFFAVVSPAGGGTTIVAELPCAS